MPEEVEFTKDPDHSPMPWRAERSYIDVIPVDGIGKIPIDDETGAPVCLVFVKHGDLNDLANVNLIERAPALLSIVEEAIPFLERMVRHTGDMAEAETIQNLLDDANRISAFARRGGP